MAIACRSGSRGEAELAALCETNLIVTLLFNYAVFAERRGEIDGRGGFADTAFLICHRDDTSHGAGPPFPPAVRALR